MTASVDKVPRNANLSLGLVLGLLSGVGPLSIDLYLPALPRMAQELAATPNQVQQTLSMFFLALAAAQIPIGSFGDRYGRKLPLYLGLGVFTLVSLACAAAVSAQALIVLRFAQGFGVCAGTICSRAMIRDLRRGPDAAQLMAMTFLVIGISPVLAPLLGSYLLTWTSWRGLFAILACLGLASLIVAWLAIPESLPAEKRRAAGSPIVKPYLALLANPRFIAGAVVAGCATTVPYAYLTAAPFVFTGAYGLTPFQYSLALGVNAIFSIASMQLSPKLMRSWGTGRLLSVSSLLGVLATGAIVGVTLTGRAIPLPLFEAYSIVMFTVAGLMLAPAATTALDAAPSGAGAAAGLMGAIQLAVTALASAIVAHLPPASLLPVLGVLGGSCFFAALLSRVATRRS